MSTRIISQQIARFLATETPEVMAIKGAWGVGKTYAWNNYLLAARNQHKIALQKYAYVSLFGINSLADLKRVVFENLTENQEIGRRPSLSTFRSNTAELLKSLTKRSLPLLPGGATAEHYRTMIDSLAFLSLQKVLICFDDFERKGRQMEAQDILGLITQLKEQKKCKVVLILNEESLSKDSSLDYARLREKVIDTELRFAPTAEDCIEIALPQGRIGSILAEHVACLGINNIRIIKKIESLANVLAPVLKKYDDLILRQALRTLTLLAWCYYSHSSQVPEYNFVLDQTSPFSDLGDELSLSTQQQAWSAVLRRYDNFSLDDFDLQIAALVENGYLDEARLDEEAERLSDRMMASRSEDSFQEAWRLFNESFDDNTSDVVARLSASFHNNAKYISPVSLDGSVRLLRYLGRNQLASRIIDLYIEKRQHESDLFKLDGNVLAGQIKDAEVVSKFHHQQQALYQQRSASELCELLLNNGGATEEEEQLAELPLAEFVSLFKAQTGPQLSQYVDLCLSYGRLGGTTEAQKKITDKAVAALKKIGRESRINASRIRRFGIEAE